MKLGFSLPTSGAWATPENQREVARRAESLGYASLWTFQRLLYPLQPQERHHELFLDLNFDPAVGAVHADAEVAMAQALRVMEALAPDA